MYRKRSIVEGILALRAILPKYVQGRSSNNNSSANIATP